jgi:hypothetical protein
MPGAPSGSADVHTHLIPRPRPRHVPPRAAFLLGVDKEGLRLALTTRTRHTPSGPIVSPLDARAAAETRDSLAKIIYAKMFDWLVAAINGAIGEDKWVEVQGWGGPAGTGAQARPMDQPGACPVPRHAVRNSLRRIRAEGEGFACSPRV